MSELLTMQDLANGHLDAKSLGQAANGDENTTVITRTGETYPSAKKAIKTMFQNGALPAEPFSTKALMTASALANGKYAQVTDDTVNNGLYVKTAGSWVKSSYDPLSQAKEDATTKANEVLSSSSESTENLIKAMFAKSQNLFNAGTARLGYFLKTNGVTLTTDALYGLSDFISVEQGEKYKRVNGSIYYFVYAYNSDKQPIVVDGARVYWSTTFEATTIPVDVAYVRVLFPVDNASTFMFTKKDVIVEDYIPPFYNAKVEGAVREEKLFAKSQNLFNAGTARLGYFLTANGVTLTTNALYGLSDFISVEQGEQYKRTNGSVYYYVYAYNSDKQPIVVDGARVFWSTTFEATLIPVDVAYVRVLFPVDNASTFMFTKVGVNTSTYIPHKIIKNELLPSLEGLVPEYIPKAYSAFNEIGLVENQLFSTDYSHLIFYGQSLSMGWEATEALTNTPVDGTYMIGNRVWINQGNSNAEVLTPLIASMGTTCGESPAVAATHDLRLLLDKSLPNNSVELIATNCGEGGQSIEKLSKESTNGINYYDTLFVKSINRAKLIANANSKTISCSAIIWMQGEYNYVGLAGAGLAANTDATNDKDAYKLHLKALKDNMQADIMSTYEQTKKPLFFMYQVAGSYINLESMSINVAMLEFASENDDVILMNPTYGVSDYGGGHLSSNGYRWYGELIAKQLYLSLIKNYRGVVVQAKEVELNSDKTRILIHCKVPKTPLVLDVYTTSLTTSYGFKVVDNTGEVAVTKVEIIGGTSIKLSLGRSLGANAYVTYAGNGRNGTGNVRDSEHWASKYVYADETNFSKKSTYTPVDSSGVRLYGKKYPMHNWLVAFYQKLT